MNFNIGWYINISTVTILNNNNNNNNYNNNNNNNSIIIIDVLGGWSVDLEETLKDPVGQRSRSVLRRTKKVILSHSLNIARAFKVLM